MATKKFKERMADIGFKEADDTVYSRIIVSIGGREKQGKTHFALTAPDPIAIFSSDIGTEGVVNKFKKAGKDVFTHDIEMPEKYEEAKKIWEALRKAYYGVLRIPEVRTVIFDTATEIWELLRICRFGKLTQVMPFQYGPVNAEFRRLLKDCYSTQKNLILLHKMKPVYIDDKRTKNFENAQFSDTPYLVQVNLEAYRTEPTKKKKRQWCIKVKDCRQNADLIDNVFKDGMCNFPFVASLIVEGTTPDDWS